MSLTTVNYPWVCFLLSQITVLSRALRSDNRQGKLKCSEWPWDDLVVLTGPDVSEVTGSLALELRSHHINFSGARTISKFFKLSHMVSEWYTVTVVSLGLGHHLTGKN